MSDAIVERLSSTLGRRHGKPNIAVAQDIVDRQDESTIQSVLSLLEHEKKAIRHDAIDVLYEIGQRDPYLLQAHFDVIAKGLDTDDNRMLWRTLATLDTLCGVVPKKTMALLTMIVDAGDRGSVIAKDKTISILTTLAEEPKYASKIAPIMLARLKSAAPNQFPTYAEKIADVIPPKFVRSLVTILEERLESITQTSKLRRIERVIAKLT